MLALDDNVLIVAVELQVNAAIGLPATLAGAAMVDPISLPNVVVCDQALERIPRYARQRIGPALTYRFSASAHSMTSSRHVAVWLNALSMFAPVRLLRRLVLSRLLRIMDGIVVWDYEMAGFAVKA